MTDPLDIDKEEMRRLGYRAIDMIVDHLDGLESEPAWRMYTRDEAERRLREPPPEGPVPFERILERLRNDVFEWRARVGHPRFMAFVPGSHNYASVLADIIAAGHNPFVGTWLGGSGPAMIELVTIDWLKEMLSLPEETGGLFTSGGSAATLVALVAAREARIAEGDRHRAVVYASDQTHACVERAAMIAGFPRANYRKIPANERFEIDVDALAAVVRGDRAEGLLPFCVVGNAGTTNTGSIDPLHRLASFAREQGLWFHVDGAYGGFAALTDRGRRLLDGIGEADSWILDPHKWLYQTFECGSVLLRRPAELRAAFRVMPDYMQDVDMGGERINFADYSHQLTRSFRALKVWMSLQYFGVGAFRQAVGRTMELARLAENTIRSKEGFEILAPATLGIVCFRILRPGLTDPELDRLNGEVQERLNRSGYALLSSTRIRGHFSLRFCILSHGTGESDVLGVLERLEEIAAGI
jgi:aromatic-L-amino-acid/L-tryptophan decarboxylase